VNQYKKATIAPDNTVIFASDLPNSVTKLKNIDTKVEVTIKTKAVSCIGLPKILKLGILLTK